MESENAIFKKIALIVKERTELFALYNQLDTAIKNNNMQSIWALSKVITRYHFKTLDKTLD